MVDPMAGHITIDDEVPRVTYAIGSTPTAGPFAIPFAFFQNSDITARVDGVTKTYGTDYTATGAPSTSGFATFAAPLSNCSLELERNTAIERTTDFPNSGPFPIPALNTELDRLVAIDQEQRRKSQDIEYSLGIETDARIAADAVLQSNLNAEASTRAAADTALGASIAQEVTDRAAGDATLQANIDALATSSSAAVGAEAATRAAADITLQGNITAEAATRSSADSALEAGKVDKAVLAEMIDTVPVADEADQTPIAVFMQQEGNVGGVVKQSGAWLVPLLELFSAVGPVPISGADDGSVDLGQMLIGSTTLAGLTVTDLAGEIGMQFDETGVLTLAGGVGIGNDLTIEWVGGADGIILMVCGEGSEFEAPVYAYLDTNFNVIKPGSTDPTVPAARSMKAELQDPLMSTWVVGLMDSIGWGLLASGRTTGGTSDHLFTDTRDNLNSNSWANRIRKYMVWLGLGTNAVITEIAPGCGEGRGDQDIPAYDEDRVVVVGGPKVGITWPRAFPPTQDRTHTFDNTLELQADIPMTVDFRGDGVSVVFAKQTTDTAATASVYIDDVLVGTIAHGNASASQKNAQRFNVTHGEHTLKVINHSHGQSFRVEAVRHHKFIRFDNHGIIGTSTPEWLPGTPLFTQAMSASVDHAWIELGTNDRERYKWIETRQNLLTIAQACEALGARPTMMAANAMVPSDGFYTFRGMFDVSSSARWVAERLGVGFIDNYSATLKAVVNGEDILGDNLHPDDPGQDIFFDNVHLAIHEERI